MIIKLNNEEFEIKDYPTMRFLKAMTEAGETPTKESDGIQTLVYASKILRYYLSVTEEFIEDCNPDEISTAFGILSDIQSRPFVEQKTKEGVES